VASLNAGVTYYLRVDEQAGYPNRMYELTVVYRLGGGGTGEGAIGAPVPIAWPIVSYSGWGQVAALGSSYYSFQTAASPGSLRVIVTPETDTFYFAGSNLTWFLFDDPGFSNEISRCDGAAGIAAQSCLTPQLAPSATYYLRVDEKDDIPQMFGLGLYGGFAPPTSSSRDVPVAIPLGSTGLDVVQDNTLSTGFYSFATTQPGTYRIQANLATGNVYGLVAWHLYDDPAFSHQVAHCFKSDGNVTSGTSCTVSLPGGMSFYLRVQAVGAQSGVPGSTVVGGNDLHLVVERLSP